MVATPGMALVRFHCSQLVIERLDPLVTPGTAPSPHVHQIVGSYSPGLDVLLIHRPQVETRSTQRWKQKRICLANRPAQPASSLTTFPMYA